jgi:hypothetical protein
MSVYPLTFVLGLRQSGICTQAARKWNIDIASLLPGSDQKLMQ